MSELGLRFAKAFAALRETHPTMPSQKLVERVGMAGLLLALVTPAHALDPNSSVWQYGHTSWRAEDGVLPGVPTALAQTRDGYLWVGTANGPVRFDGIKFRPMLAPDGSAQLGNMVNALLAGSDGSLWIGFVSSAARWRDGKLWNFEGASHVNQFQEASNGDIYYSRTRIGNQTSPLGRVSGDKQEYLGDSSTFGLPYIDQFVLGRDGTFWFGMPQGLLEWDGKTSETLRPEGMATRPTTGFPKAVELSRDGSVWVGYANDGATYGLQHLVNGRLHGVPLPVELGQPAHISTLYEDREGSLWIGTEDRGLFRFRAGQVQRFDTRDGLSGDSVLAILEDAQGNLWVSTNSGLDRFRTLRFTSITTRDGLTSNAVQSVAVAPDGSLWVADLQALDHLRGGRVVGRLLAREAAQGDQFTRVFVDRQNRVWAGIDDELAVYKDGHFHRVRRRDGQPAGVITDISQDASGAIWVSTTQSAHSLLKVLDDQVLAPTDAPISARRLFTSASNELWTADLKGMVRVTSRGLERFDYRNKITQATSNGMANGPSASILSATSKGLAIWKDGATRFLTQENGLPCDRLNGVVADHSGDVWLSAACGVIRIKQSDLARWLSGVSHSLQAQTYGPSDGAQTAPTAFGNPGVVTPDGLVWFASSNRLMSFDPTRIVSDQSAPNVQVEEVVADHKRFATVSPLNLGTNPRELEIDYSSTNLAAPDRVRYRYRLEGHDENWSAPVTRREAIYTDLSPGKYRFQVIASNDGGEWGERPANLDIVVPPTILQSRWFTALCIIAAGLALVGAMRLRLRQVRLRLQMREQERERIARELHDTVLQGTQGMVILLHAKASQLPLSESQRADFERVLARAENLLREGRDRIYGLRSSDRLSSELFSALSQEGESFSAANNVEFTALVKGESQLIEAADHDELRRIGSEAIANAFYHAEATLIQLEINLRDREIELVVRDDGVGFDASGIIQNRTKHWGIIGMRERAKRIGAHFVITKRNPGTQISVTLPIRKSEWIERRLARMVRRFRRKASA